MNQAVGGKAHGFFLIGNSFVFPIRIRVSKVPLALHSIPYIASQMCSACSTLARRTEITYKARLCLASPHKMEMEQRGEQSISFHYLLIIK